MAFDDVGVHPAVGSGEIVLGAFIGGQIEDDRDGRVVESGRELEEQFAVGRLDCEGAPVCGASEHRSGRRKVRVGHAQ